MDNSKNTRVQFNDFKKEYFNISPIWEFAIDEEGNEGQDETTLKPRLDISLPDPSEGLLIIECDFESKKGKKYAGFCSPAFEDNLSSIQPHIFTGNEFVMFWLGISQPNNKMKNEIYTALGEKNEDLFPIKFVSKLPMPNGKKINGQINGFMWMNLSNNSIITEK